MKQSLNRRMQAQQQQRVAWYGASRRHAEELIRTGNYAEAVRVLSRLRSIRPGDQEVRRLLNVAQAHLGRPLPPERPGASMAAAGRPSALKVATFVVSLLALIAAGLQVGHDVFGLSFSPIEAAQNAIRPVFQSEDGSGTSSSGEVTIPGGAAAPTTPQNLRLVAQDGCTATLAWDPAQDDVAVAKYWLYRDGRRSDLADGTITQLDVQLLPGEDQRFTVQASDGLNESGQSNEVTVPACSASDL
jgi:hypothetical protein